MSRTNLTTKFQTMVGNEPEALVLSAKGPTTVLELVFGDTTDLLLELMLDTVTRMIKK